MEQDSILLKDKDVHLHFETREEYKHAHSLFINALKAFAIKEFQLNLKDEKKLSKQQIISIEKDYELSAEELEMFDKFV